MDWIAVAHDRNKGRAHGRKTLLHGATKGTS
jgi:hypothetical protein